MRLAHEFGLWNQPGVTVTAAAPAADADLELVHDEPYVTTVKAISRWAEHPDARGGLEGTQLRVARMFGLGTEDNPVFPGMHEASALVAGRPWPRPAPSGQARPSMGPASRAACIMRWPRMPAGSASTTTRRSRSPGYWTGRRARRLRGHRRAPLPRGAGRVLRRSAGADDQPAPAPGDPVPLHRPARRDRRARRRGQRSMSRCPPGPGDAKAGCAPSTRSSRRCCASSSRRSWSASTAATRTGSIPWPTWN